MITWEIPSVLAKIFAKYRTVILYFIIGSSAAALDLIIYLVLFNWLAIPAVAATIISVSCATAHGFILNVVYNFKVKDRMLQRFLTYAGVSGVGIVLSASMLYVFYNRLGINGNIVKIVSLPLIFVVQYLLNRYISFKKTAEVAVSIAEEESRGV